MENLVFLIFFLRFLFVVNCDDQIINIQPDVDNLESTTSTTTTKYDHLNTNYDDAKIDCPTGQYFCNEYKRCIDIHKTCFDQCLSKEEFIDYLNNDLLKN